jgi:hypothetical protein
MLSHMNDATDLVELVRGKWYEPITMRIEKFEQSANVFGEVAAVVEPKSPEWAVQCALRGMKPFGEVAGFPFNGEFGAENVGALVGSKSSICVAMAKAHEWAAAMDGETEKKLLTAFGKESFGEAKAIWKRFAEKLHPKFETVRRFAVELSMRQNYFEDVKFHRGLAKGLTLMEEMRKRVRKAVRKAERDAQSRAAVYFFGVLACETVEANRRELSWPELNKAFNEAFEYRVPIDEDAFKKILQRCGLRVGKVGRRVEVSI